MKRKTRILLLILVALMLFAMLFAVPSGSMLWESRSLWRSWAWCGEGLLELLTPSAGAEGEKLPVDFSPGMTPNPDAYTEDGYEDESITVRMETVEKDGTVWRVAYVQVRDASQLRTGISGSSVHSDYVAMVSTMAKRYQAIVAVSGDYYINDPERKTFEYRMGTMIRDKANRYKDLLIIDDLGDFHIFIRSDAEALQAFLDGEREIVNAFTFGPALVTGGELLTCGSEYDYDPLTGDPRMGIGQLDTLSYVLVLAEGRHVGTKGATHQKLADFMYELGCKEAYNLDGGNSATMIFHDDYYQTYRTRDNERAQSDIVYFATSVDPAAWSDEQ